MLNEKTTKQIEDNIDLGVNQELLQYVRDYISKFYDMDMKTIQDNISIIVNHIEGSEAVVAAIPSVYPPSDTDPTGTPDTPVKKGSFYFNRKEKEFRSFNGSAWTLMANLSHVVDLNDYYTSDEVDNLFVEGRKGTLSELYDAELGKPVEDQDLKYLNITEIAELIKDQREIDRNFLANFKDELTYKNSDKVAYRDTTLDIETLEATVQTNGNAVTYTTLIHPYDRINQEQANFEGTFEVDASVEYLFNSKFKAVKFTGTAGQTYKWETFGKLEDSGRVPYIRFSGTATMETSNNPLDNNSWVAHALPFEMKLSDLMDEVNRTAIVTFKFTTLPAFGTHFMTINYLTSTYYVETRFANFIKGLDLRIKSVEGAPNVYAFPMAVGGFNNVVITYKHTDIPATMKVGEEFLLNIDPSLLNGVNDTTTMLMQDESKVSGDPTQNFASLEAFQWQPNTNQNDKDTFKFARRWDFFKNQVDAYWVVVKKSEDFDGKTIWIPQGWRAKPQTPGDMQLVDRVVPAANVWAEYQTSKASGKIVYINAHNTNQIESNASAFWRDSNLRFDKDGRAVANVSNGHERQFRMVAGGIEILEQGSLQRTQPYTQWDKFEFYELKGKAFVDTKTANVDPALSWVDVGPGHGDQVMAFDDAGKPRFREYFGKPKADTLYEPKSFDFSGSELAVNLNVTGGKRYQIITQPANAANTPINAYNKLKLAMPGAPQDNDQVTYGSDLIWIYKNATDIMEWHEIKDNVEHGDVMVIQHLSNGHWQLVRWEINPAPKTDGGRFAEARVASFPLASDLTAMNALWDSVIGGQPINKDHIEVELEDLSKYALYTFDGTKWTKGNERTTHIKGGTVDFTPIYNSLDAEETARVRDINEIWAEIEKRLNQDPIRFGINAGKTNQDSTAMAIGGGAGLENQGAMAMAFGNDAGAVEQGAYAMAFGHFAGRSHQLAHSIIMSTVGGDVALPGVDEMLFTTRTAKLLIGTNSKIELTASEFKVNDKVIANANLDNVDNADLINKLTSAGIQSNILNEMKGVLSADPAGPHTDLDWYINDTTYTIRVWHGGAWHDIGGATHEMTKAEIIAKIGLTVADITNIKTIPQLGKKDGSNWNFGTAHAGKYLKVKSDGTPEWANSPNLAIKVYDSTGRYVDASSMDGSNTDKVLVTKKHMDAIDNHRATTSLNNVNVGTGNAGKFLKVKADGHLEYVDAPSGGDRIKTVSIKSGFPDSSHKTTIYLPSGFDWNNVIACNLAGVPASSSSGSTTVPGYLLNNHWYCALGTFGGAVQGVFYANTAASNTSIQITDVLTPATLTVTYKY